MIGDSLPYLGEFEDLWFALKPYRPIAFGTRLARITGRPKDAMLLSQLVYWTRRGRDVGGNGGWVHKTREHWFAETGLSREEQENARRRLRDRALVVEWRGGRPACLHYRLDVRAMSAAVRTSCRMVGPLPASIEAIRTDEVAVQELLGPTVAFRRVFVDLTGNVNAALLLSRMVQLQRREADHQATWFTQTGIEWQRTLGLNRAQQENARRRLVRQGLIRELTRPRTGKRVFTQVNATELRHQLERLVSRVDVRDRLATRRELIARSVRECTAALTDALPPVTPGNSLAATVNPQGARDAGAWRNPPTQSRQPSHEPGHESARAQGVPLLSERFARYRWRQTYISNARAYTRITYSTTTTMGSATTGGLTLVAHGARLVVVGVEKDTAVVASSAAADARADGLLWPAMLPPAERSLVGAHLQRIPAPERQVLLDEMAASHRHRPVQSPVAYIAGLVRRCLAGDFVPARAHLERAVRERAQVAEGAVIGPCDYDSPDSGPGRSHVSTPATARLHLAAIRAGLKRGRCGQAGHGGVGHA
ncbi:MAG: hypothetical protein PCALPYG88_5685 [uncultured Paraburkholderia sp.]|uniref:hypothetical protein n=1 Tax=uncultured Paraburkholderia sp. TaxID=1822466 RepID=UPI00259685DC|nr:hypothetical protein [uncultured Paraburkholderia sp.]CAH2902170.1 MAG: hypothetical protein PCALPYG08_5859 [uncultured Paraburkholderia sp.]CAH2936412.1 MAG: hypothetical protein PCALPYG88_5685 [uncultured Paraburkholderia sp.]